ncbi:MAG: ABC transporter ATP-binding protein [Thermogutta sp.]
MSDVAIRVENLSKKFVLGERLGFRTFRETLQDALAAPIRLIKGDRGNGTAAERKVDTDTHIWALKDVSFEVKHGEVLGIIGPNGAGKSTLLKILSRITEPSAGYVEIRGRVGSLLEVGTGFHPELTGRENVYLNGAILGMSKAEIRRKFDDIVSFAGVEKFIDTPVKRYSSGMQVRLAFAVAAHLDPEILIVDEVLAVGDAEFQKRCLGKMDEVSRSGRTILFVSHNMAAVEALCHASLLLANGRLIDAGPAAAIISQYIRCGAINEAKVDLLTHPNRQRGLVPLFRSLRILDSTGALAQSIPVGHDISLELLVSPDRPMRDLRIAYLILNSMGQLVAKCYSFHQHRSQIHAHSAMIIRCTLRGCRLMPGDYTISIVAYNGTRLVDRVDSSACFQIANRDLYGTGRMPDITRSGFYLPEAKWTVRLSQLDTEVQNVDRA